MSVHVRASDEITGRPGMTPDAAMKAYLADIAVRDSDLDHAEARARADGVWDRHLADQPSTELFNRMIDEIIEGP